MTTKDKVQQGLRCTSTHTSCTVPSSNRRTWTQFKIWWFKCNHYGIQKLKNQKNPRSMQIMTVWPSRTNTNGMRIDCSRGHRLLTPGQSRSKQAISDTLQSSKEANKNNKGIKVTLSLPKTRCKKGSYLHSQAALCLPQMQWLVHNPRLEHSQAINNKLFKRSWIKTIGDRSQSWPFRETSLEENSVLFHLVSPRTTR
jgi:hypothetical protein